MIVPKAVRFLFEIELLKRNQGDVKQIMRQCDRMLAEQSDKVLAKKALAQICSILAGLKYHADEESRERYAGIILARSLEFADFETFRRALSLKNLSSSDITLIAKALADHGLNALRPA